MCLLPKCAFLIILAAHYTEQKICFPDKLEIRDAYRCFERFPKMVVFDLGKINYWVNLLFPYQLCGYPFYHQLPFDTRDIPGSIPGDDIKFATAAG